MSKHINWGVIKPVDGTIRAASCHPGETSTSIIPQWVRATTVDGAAVLVTVHSHLLIFNFSNSNSNSNSRSTKNIFANGVDSTYSVTFPAISIFQNKLNSETNEFKCLGRQHSGCKIIIPTSNSYLHN